MTSLVLNNWALVPNSNLIWDCSVCHSTKYFVKQMHKIKIGKKTVWYKVFQNLVHLQCYLLQLQGSVIICWLILSEKW